MDNDTLRIALYDDSAFSLDVQSELLRAEGFQVRSARNLDSFRAMISEWKPNLILLDVNTPEINGADLCTQIKRADATQRTPVVLFSGLPEPVLKDLAERCGADGFLSKDGFEGYGKLGGAVRELVDSILW